MANNKWTEITRQVIDAIDIRDAYTSLGLEITGSHPNSSGWLACRAYGRDDQNPSAGINVGDGPARGRYKDFGGSGLSCTLFDFAAQYGGFEDWKDARKQYASAANVKLGKGMKPPERVQDGIYWKQWNEVLAEGWVKHKPPVTVESLAAAGGGLGMWPAEIRKYPVVYLPIFGEDLTDSDPTGYVIWRRNGSQIPLFQGKNKPPKPVKMLTIKGSKSGWMGLHGIRHLAEAQMVWKVEGPTDMMALMGSIPDALRDRHIVLTNSGGAGEAPKDWQIDQLVGKQVNIVHDNDEPGQKGATVWCNSLAESGILVKNVQLRELINE
jgi:hypothetical protein